MVASEDAVIACILHDNDLYYLAREHGLTPQHFASTTHSMVFRIAGDIISSGETADYITVRTRLEQTGQYHGVVASTYAHVGDEIPDHNSFASYADSVVNSALKRKVQNMADRMDDLALSDLNTEEVLTAIRTKLDELEGFADASSSRRRLVEIKQAVDEYIATLDNEEPQEIPTGFYAIDDLIVGLVRGGLYIIAGRPGLGKSSLALNIVKNVSMQGIRAGLISLEMGSDEIALRMLSDVANVPGEKMRKRVLETADRKAIEQARDEISKMRIFINDAGESKMDSLIARIKSMAIKERLGLIVLDYLQLLDSSGTRWEEVSKLSRSLKMLAKELNLPVIALSQLNRKVEERPKHVPMLSDLRESGSIEQDANVVMLLYRPGYYQDGETNATGSHGVVDAQVIVAKNRSGARGVAQLHWSGAFTRFENVIEQASFPGVDSSAFEDDGDQEVVEGGAEGFQERLDAVPDDGRGDGGGTHDAVEREAAGADDSPAAARDDS